MINTFWKHSPRSQIILYKPKRLLFKFFYVSSFEMMLNSKCHKSPFRCGFKLQQVVRTTAIHMTALMQVYWHCGSTVCNVATTVSLTTWHIFSSKASSLLLCQLSLIPKMKEVIFIKQHSVTVPLYDPKTMLIHFKMTFCLSVFCKLENFTPAFHLKTCTI